MNAMLVALTTVLLMLTAGEVDKSNSDSQAGVVYARAGAQAVITLEVETAPGLLVNRKNPPLISLRHPFKGETTLTAEVTGEPWSEEPDTYFSQLAPIVWALAIPEGTEAGHYPLTIEGDFPLCDSALGLCFTENREAAVSLQVGTGDSDVENRAATVFLSTSDF